VRRVLALLVLAYVATGVLGALAAVERGLAATVPVPRAHATIAADALLGWGTALSVAGPALALFLVLALLVPSSDGGGRVAAVLLIPLGVLAGLKAVAEPVVRMLLDHLGKYPALSAVALSAVVLPTLIVVVALAVVIGELGQDRRF
jgi:hypothetical protein